MQHEWKWPTTPVWMWIFIVTFPEAIRILCSIREKIARIKMAKAHAKTRKKGKPNGTGQTVGMDSFHWVELSQLIWNQKLRTYASLRITNQDIYYLQHRHTSFMFSFLLTFAAFMSSQAQMGDNNNQTPMQTLTHSISNAESFFPCAKPHACVASTMCTLHFKCVYNFILIASTRLNDAHINCDGCIRVDSMRNA